MTTKVYTEKEYQEKKEREDPKFLPPYYLIDEQCVNVEQFYDFTGHNPFLNDKEKKNMQLCILSCEREYNAYAWEHWALVKAKNTTHWRRNYYRHFYKTEVEYDARIAKLLRLLQTVEREYAVYYHKLQLHERALDDHFDGSQALIKQYAEKLQEKTPLHQGSLFSQDAADNLEREG